MVWAVRTFLPRLIKRGDVVPQEIAVKSCSNANLSVEPGLQLISILFQFSSLHFSLLDLLQAMLDKLLSFVKKDGGLCEGEQPVSVFQQLSKSPTSHIWLSLSLFLTGFLFHYKFYVGDISVSLLSSLFCSLWGSKTASDWLCAVVLKPSVLDHWLGASLEWLLISSRRGGGITVKAYSKPVSQPKENMYRKKN